MPIDIILYALIVAGLVFWLHRVLGTRHGEEKDRRPSPPLDSDKAPLLKAINKEKNVVNLTAHLGDKFNLPMHVKIENKTAENKLLDIAKLYESFDLEHFAAGVPDAFSIVVEAFAGGDKETLKGLLAEPVYQAFVQEIDAREKRGEKITTEIHAVRKVDILKAEMKEDTVLLTVRFTAQETCVIRDEQGDIISGNPDKITEMVDVWVFGRDLKKQGPEWLVYETRDDEIEEHKTPLPES